MSYPILGLIRDRAGEPDDVIDVALRTDCMRWCRLTNDRHGVGA